MAVRIVEKGTRQTFFANFKKEDGSAAPITGTPQIRIQHVEAGSVVTDQAATNMTQIASESKYFFEYFFNEKAKETNYQVTYTATIQGVAVVGTEEVRVVDKDAFGGKGGGYTSRIQIPVLTKEEKSRLFVALERIEALAGTTPPEVDLSPLLGEIKSLKDNKELLNHIITLRQEFRKQRNALIKDIAYFKDAQRELTELTGKTFENKSKEIKEIVDQRMTELNEKTEFMEKAFVKILSDEDLEALLDERQDTE